MLEYSYSRYRISAALHRVQLFHFGFWCRIILLVSTNCVRINLILKSMAKQFSNNIFYFIFSIGNRWPFDWKTPVGYLVAWFGESIGMIASVLALIPFLSYLFGTCMLLYFIANDITNDLTAFNSTVAIDTNPLNAGNRAKFSRKFCAIVQICSDAKE